MRLRVLDDPVPPHPNTLIPNLLHIIRNNNAQSIIVREQRYCLVESRTLLKLTLKRPTNPHRVTATQIDPNEISHTESTHLPHH